MKERTPRGPISRKPYETQRLLGCWKGPHANDITRESLVILWGIVKRLYYGAADPYYLKPVENMDWKKVTRILLQIQPDLKLALHTKDGVLIPLTIDDPATISRVRGRWYNMIHDASKRKDGTPVNRFTKSGREHPLTHPELCEFAYTAGAKVALWFIKSKEQ